MTSRMQSDTRHLQLHFIPMPRHDKVFKMNGADSVMRAKIKKEKTGSCPVCTINLYFKNKRPLKKTMPCNIDVCPFSQESQLTIAEQHEDYVVEKTEAEMSGVKHFPSFSMWASRYNKKEIFKEKN